MSVLLLLTAVGLAVQAAHCPGECSCREPTSHDTTSSLACTGPVLDLPPETGSLTIRTEASLDLPAILSTLQDTTLPRLIQLNLAECSIDSLVNITFSVLANLQTLDLSLNHITDLPDDPELFNLTRLRDLDLSHNLIHTIYGSPFRTLRALRLLNLSGNAIDTISVDAFRGPAALQSLDLSMNNMTALPARVFVPLVGLQHLNLSGNRLEALADGCFGSLLRLQQLDVSWNRLTHVAPGTLQALPSLSRLLLAGNPNLGGGIKEAALLVGTGRRLQTVDASRTGLKHVPATLTHSVRTLRLAGNSIRTIRCGDLDSYPLLQLLDLTTNVLSEIEEDALGRLEVLAVLYLTDNKLQAMPRSLPDGLEILHLEFNKIEQIVSGDLLGLPKLEVLLLNDNAIKVVQEGAFSQVTSLVTLDLSRNPISILPADTLAGPTRLQMLRLADLTVDPPAEDMTFPVPSPEHLVRLDLSGSVGLARQLLADSAALVAFRELQELNLANTDLTNLRSDLLHYLPQMHDFHLIGNRLNCTGLLWLALWMRRQDEPEYRKVSCASPPELYGTLVVDLQDTDVQDVVSTMTVTTRTSTFTSTPSTTTSTTTVESTTATTTMNTITERTATQSTIITEGTSVSAAAVTEFANSQDENTFNNITVNEQADRSTVQGLQNTVKSSVVEEKTTTGQGMLAETTDGVGGGWHSSSISSTETTTTTDASGSVFVTEAGHRSGVADAAADRVHLFPIALGTGSWTDETGATPPVTDGHIYEINPSDNRVASEPSNYKTNAPPPPSAAAAVVASVGSEDTSGATAATEIPGGDGAARTSATAASRDSERAAESLSRYANQPDNFFRNRAHDNVTGETPRSNVFMGPNSSQHHYERQQQQQQQEKIIAGPAGEHERLEDEENIAGTAGEMSMYSSGRHTDATSMGPGGLSMHPGMLVLLGAVLGAGIVLSTLVSHVRRRRKRGAMDAAGYNRHQDIEVNSLASMHELW